MNVWQVVGYKNSGKTTLIEKWIKQASQEGYKVGTVKHHGHGGNPDVCHVTNDSSRHQQAGAIVTSVEGNGLLQLHAFQPQWTLSQILSVYSLLPIDFTIVEGYKREQYKKIVMLRTDEDWSSLSVLTNIVAVITWEPSPLLASIPYPVFLINDEKRYLQWLMNEVRKAV
ncbi:molybdopterin-guanine dinucleotide biosynthesis protein B [Thermaerobacillus caldiproteolyticus]|uniref:Molybdopterin-guanine dinucleotide biosynthesis protein B n=1 Tax=Thermaerobacillus caldiproteolyticus TaxID=247480 RepID=A0A7V9Z6N9_9BACL|nr:molybdopterin-guanine dinucleotide biosynthesis protein B [Anoxybacillus caldiproteolyticus]MBA2874903.1 molybdopterin-guanine dinucleotide biosynthesis protein B [Anoxybacillus caldiproteolyticus]